MNFLALNHHPELSAVLGYDAVIRYVDLICCLKPTIALQQASYLLDPPESLSEPVHEFLKICLSIPDEAAKLAWAVLRKLAWDFEATEVDEEALHHKYVKLFMEHGLS